jgi:hypothetical protein
MGAIMGAYRALHYLKHLCGNSNMFEIVVQMHT